MGWQAPSQWLINVNKGAGGNCNGWYLNAQKGLCRVLLPLRQIGACDSQTDCTLRFCAVVRLSIGPVDDVGSVTKIYENLEGHAILWRFMNHTEEKPSCWLINHDFLDSDAPIFEMSEEKKTYRKKDMECHHRYLCSYRAPRLDTIRNNKRKQLLFHDLSTWSATDSIWFSAIAAYILAFQNPSIELLFDKTAWDSRTVNRRPLRQMKAAFKLKKRNKGMQGARFSRHFSSSSQPRCFEQARLTHSREPARPTNCLNRMSSMGLRWLSRSINGQNPSSSGRSSVSTRMLLLPRSNSHLLRLDLESHRSGAFVAQIGAPTIRYGDLDPWTEKFTLEWIAPSMLRCYTRWWGWWTKLQGTEVVVWLLCAWWAN